MPVLRCSLLGVFLCLLLAAGASAAVQPTLTAAGSDAEVGGDVHVTATLSGGAAATGTIEYKLFGPNDATCANSPLFADSDTVAGDDEYSSEGFTTSQVGTYHWSAEYSGDAENEPASSLCTATSTVSQAAPELTSIAADGTAGGSISDTATVSGGFSPGGTLTFKAFGPGNATCAGAAAYTNTVPVSGNGSYGSGNLTNALAGSYRWTIEYTGDTNNAAKTSGCNATNELSTVSKASPTIATVATSGTVGGTIKDTATIAAGVTPTGNVVFKAFGPNDATCSGAAAFTKSVPVNGNGAYDSTNFTTSAAGAYRWTAEYGGDANNNSAISGCNASEETSTVAKATTALSTTATSAAVGAAIKDTATLSGGFSPTGSLVFKAFGPNDATCANAAAFTKTVAVSGNGEYGSTNFTTAAAGSYRWTVEYSGDANNNAATSGCNAANETSTVGQVTPTLSSVATNGTAGGTIKDTANLAGFNPTGTLTFSAFGPANPTCTGAASFTKVVAVAGNASYDSTAFSNPLAGAYRWTIAYSGDANNAAVTSACNASEETSTVGKATPTIATVATSGTVGGTIKDTATIGSGVTPTGNVVFKAFGPNDTTCANAAAFTATIPVAGNAAYGSGDFTVTQVGEYRWTAEYSGDANNNAATSSCNASLSETSTVGKVTPTVTSNAASTIFPGSISDAATFAAGFNPTGSLVFKAWGPENPACTGVPAFTKAVAVTGNGTYGSGTFENPAIGTYRWTVEYAGDANNNQASSNCNASGGTSFVNKVPPQLSLSGGNAAIGGAIASFAAFGGGLSHTGQVVFKLYGPNDATCSGAPVFTSNPPLTVTVGNNTYGSGPFTPAQAGTYRWTAAYSGDATNAAETTPCSAAVSSVAPATPSISAHLSPATITLGEGVRDTATLGGGFKPGGTIGFSLYGPGDTSCGSSPTLTATAAVSGNGNYASPQLVPKQPGDYRFVVSYSGDASNTAARAACGAGGEFVDVQKRLPALKARASVKGKKIVAKATLSGAASPTGKVTFRIYAPSDSRCARKPLFSSAVSVKGTTATAAGYRFTRKGLYRFSVAYAGDERNQPVKNACTVRGQSIRVK